MLLLSEAAVDACFDPATAIAATRAAFVALAEGRVTIPLRGEIHRQAPGGLALIMPGLAGNEILGLKLVGHVDDVDDPSRKYTTGMMLVWDAATLRPRALLAADTFNDHRTAAGIAVATDVLARPEASVLVQFGVGKIAFEAVRYVARVRRLERVHLFGRRPGRAEAMAERLRAHPDMAGVVIDTATPVATALAAADIVTTVTTAETPVFDGSLLRPGCHVNLAGANRPEQREMDDAVAARAWFVLDEATACRARAGDVLVPLASGVLEERRILGELGDVLRGTAPGRPDPAAITVFKSLGVAVQDLFVADDLVTRAEREGRGQRFDHLNG
ncbi:MAG: ornithine cyclodeaminase family protein [Geminicoccaceae bacterium]|nr:MAG: ornithine cyclodeaminase family protein [Geminicoccaceae bacterium]